ncbi:TonB-dependent receptor [Flavobacterium sp. NRK F10]|uniref:TonB-dependent receptor domain-containing protein n=1 Tax=Flavobacterium sp. NRK F10 TaxID=2954931 RepID=UPI0020903923|nr:TonB-dependent receptor [Flavobacterium sp. NRK F10]MCO6174083.1 TonB-dependent receptor [Flavobacterium sp. NRK F10]
MKKIIMSLGLLAFTVSHAQENQKNTTDSTKVTLLNEVLVTGNQINDPAQVIVKQDYTEKVVQPKNSGELFQGINGFSLIKRGNYAVDPSFRASQYEQLNVQIDGGTKAFHACPNRMDPVTTLVNPEEVTKIEIIKGPFSVRYGNTFAGLINLVTKTPAYNEKKISGSLSSGYESNGKSIVNMLELGTKIKKFDFTGNISYRDYGNYEDGNQNEIPSSFRSTNYGLKAGYDITENQRLQASFKQNFGRDVLHAGLPMDTDEDNSTLAALDYKWNSTHKTFKSLTSKLYYSYVDHTMSNTRRPSFMMMEAVSNVEALTYGGKIETKWQFSPKVVLFTGVDMVNLSRDGGRDRLVKVMNGNPLPMPMSFYDKVWQDSYTNDTGVFAEAKIKTSDKSVVTIGSRMDFIAAEAKDLDPTFAALYPNLDKQTEANYSGTVSYKYTFNPNYNIEFSFGRGTRAATIEERYIAFFNIGRDTYEYVGNPYLKPEVNNQFEIGFNGKHNFNGFVSQLRFGSSVFYSIYENYILGVVDESLTRKYNPTTPPVHPKVFRNIDNALKTGFEIYANADFANHFNFSTEISYTYTENKDFNESLPLTPPLTTRLKLSYEIKKFWASAQYTLTAKQNKISYSYDEIATSGYEVMDIKLGYKPFESLSLGAGVLNLFDQYYNNHLTFAFNNVAGYGRVPITEPGRNFTFFVNYKF